MKHPSYIVRVTDKGSGESVYLKYPHSLPPVALENLQKRLAGIAKSNPEFTLAQVAAHAADLFNQQSRYASYQTEKPIRATSAPWDYEVAYGEAKERKKSPSQRFTVHVRCLADCVTEVTFPQGGMTVETATAYVKAHLDEFDAFRSPHIVKACEVVEGSGCLENDCPPLAEVVCVDDTFTAATQTAKCVKFSRRLTDQEASFFRSCLKEFSPGGPGVENASVVAYAVKLFNATAQKQGWDVTAEVLEHLEPWHRMMDYDLYKPEPGPSLCRLCGED